MKAPDNMEEEIGSYLVRETLQGDATGFDNNTDLIRIAAIDSLSMVDLVVFLEEKFGIVVGPAEVNPSNLKSVTTIAAMVRRLKPADRR